MLSSSSSQRAADAPGTDLVPQLFGFDEAIALDESDVCVFLVPGACVLQRQVAGHWIDQQIMYRPGIIATRLPGLMRISGTSAARGVVLRLSGCVTSGRIGEIAAVLRDDLTVSLEADPVIDSLLQVLKIASSALATRVHGPVVEAIALRLEVLLSRHAPREQGKQPALPSWRLTRVIDFVSNRLSGPISLAEMASAAGLSPMHFAAQFKAATGMRPHHYLVARRLESAKTLLGDTNSSIVDIAMAVGFQTQSHFATVFKRHERVTPKEWRKARTGVLQAHGCAVHRGRGSSRAHETRLVDRAS